MMDVKAKNGLYTGDYDKIPVKLGELLCTTKPEKYHLLGIGTCLGIYMYDTSKEIYCIAHTVLPKYSEFKNRYLQKRSGKFTDLAIHLMYEKLIEKKCHPSNIECKIVGGAQIYEDSFHIGTRNIKVAYATFKELNITLKAEKVGKSESRSILSFNRDGSMNLRIKGNYSII